MAPKPSPDLIPKGKAAVYLGKSPRMLNYYRAEGRIQAIYMKRDGRDEAFYERDALDKLKAELEAPAFGVGGEIVAATPLQPVASGFTDALLRSIERAEQAILARPVALTELAVKPILTLAEARRLTGIPRHRLMAAIHAKELRALRGTLGRGWRIRRRDLENWIDSLIVV